MGRGAQLFLSALRASAGQSTPSREQHAAPQQHQQRASEQQRPGAAPQAPRAPAQPAKRSHDDSPQGPNKRTSGGTSTAQAGAGASDEELAADLPAGSVLAPPVAALVEAARPGVRARLVAAAAALEHAVAPSTARAYEREWGGFVAFCGEVGVSPFSASDAVVGLYLGELVLRAGDKGVGAGLVQRASAAIGFMFEARGLQRPTGGPTAAVALQAAKRTLTGRRLARDYATAADLRALAAHHLSGGAAAAPLRDLEAITAFTLMFAAALRCSDLQRVSCGEHHLRITSSGMDVFLPRSKTDQAGKGAWLHVAALPPGAAGPCAVTLVRCLLQRGGYDRSSSLPLFRSARLASAPVSRGELSGRLGGMAAAAGIDRRLTLHSFRIGAATAAAAAGMPLADVMRLGRWQSEQVCRGYIRGPAVISNERPSVMAALGLL